MIKKWLTVLVFTSLVGSLVVACNRTGIINIPTLAFVGSSQCAGCHQGIYDTFILSGHPYKLNEVVNGQAPDYPYSDVPNPPAGYTWADVAYVIGGFGWKARFVGLDGFIITGDASATTQYNLATQGWVPYHAGEEKPYDCGTCHTTGYMPGGNQDGLPGLIGTWSEPGVHCEACHGPGSDHVAAPSAMNINLNYAADDSCALCHIRDDITVIDASSGFIKHHEQAEEMLQSPHNAVLECTSCHDPHKSVLYSDQGLNPDQGLVAQCADCHQAQAEFGRSATMEAAGVSCRDCHMPHLAKSAIGDLDTFTGDIRTHLFDINVDPDAPQFSADGSEAMGYITLSYACQQCHVENGSASVRDLEDLAAYAEDYHTPVVDGQYIGSEMCSACHQTIYDTFQLSGHPYKLNEVENGMPPEYPYSSVPNTPDGTTWNDVSYVIGGFGWKARFVGLDGYIITGDSTSTTQYNLATQGWVPYHAGETKAYDCGPCHTTGYSPTGNQDGRPGITGTWSQPGVHCEACHGPGGTHFNNPGPSTINIGMDPDDSCILCHIRGDTAVIDASGGFIKHHEQSEEMLQSPHNGILECSTCHNPHQSVLYSDPVLNPDMGLEMTCDQCHPSQTTYGVTAMETAGIECTDCHMAQLAKSAIGDISMFTGDIASHLFEINTDPLAPQFNAAGTEAFGYITLPYACQQCHISGGIAPVFDLDTLATNAQGFH